MNNAIDGRIGSRNDLSGWRSSTLGLFRKRAPVPAKQIADSKWYLVGNTLETVIGNPASGTVLPKLVSFHLRTAEPAQHDVKHKTIGR